MFNVAPIINNDWVLGLSLDPNPKPNETQIQNLILYVLV